MSTNQDIITTFSTKYATLQWNDPRYEYLTAIYNKIEDKQTGNDLAGKLTEISKELKKVNGNPDQIKDEIKQILKLSSLDIDVDVDDAGAAYFPPPRKSSSGFSLGSSLGGGDVGGDFGDDGNVNVTSAGAGGGGMGGGGSDGAANGQQGLAVTNPAVATLPGGASQPAVATGQPAAGDGSQNAPAAAGQSGVAGGASTTVPPTAAGQSGVAGGGGAPDPAAGGGDDE